MEIRPVRTKHFQLLYFRDQVEHNLFQVSFGSDGSIYFGSEFFPNRYGEIRTETLPRGQNTMNIQFSDASEQLKIIEKTSLHASGQTHVTVGDQNEKIEISQIRPLSDYDGHLFTIQIQGFQHFQTGHPSIFTQYPGPIQTLRAPDFHEAVRVVAWYQDFRSMAQRIPNKDAVIGPKIPVYNDITKTRTNGFIISPVEGMKNDHKAIILQFIPTKRLDLKNSATVITLTAFAGPQGFISPTDDLTFRTTRQILP